MSYELRCRLKGASLEPSVLQVVRSFGDATANGQDGAYVDREPDVFVSADLTSADQVCISFSFGGDIEEPHVALEWARHLRDRLDVAVFDPQLEADVDPKNPTPVLESWVHSNRLALKQFSDGYHSLRSRTQAGGKLVMLEAIREASPSWRNYCMVGVAFTKIGDYDAARDLFRRALKMAPSEPSIHYSMGLTLYQ